MAVAFYWWTTQWILLADTILRSSLRNYLLIKLTFTTRKRLEIGDKLCKAQNYLSSNKNCDGLAVVVIGGEKFVSQLIKFLGPSQCALSLAKLRLFIFQSIVDRGQTFHGESDERNKKSHCFHWKLKCILLLTM